MPTETTPMVLTTSDGERLQAEWAPASSRPGRAAAVLCHPHPQFGGTMRSLVISALFDALPREGVDCLRFNFRGVEQSTGTFDGGDRERNDVRAALRAVAAAGPAPADRPVVLMGWSFGADLALSVRDRTVAGWLAVACPLRYARDLDELAADPRPKLVALAEHDEVRAPAEVEAVAAAWRSTTVSVVGGASHFFVGRTDRVVALALQLVDQVLAPPG